MNVQLKGREVSFYRSDPDARLLFAWHAFAEAAELGALQTGTDAAVCVLDNHHAGTTAAFVNRRTAELAVAESARRGYLNGRASAGMFAWLRPTGLIWNYLVNDYLLGKDPPPLTFSTGPPTPPTCRRRCTATSSSCQWRTRS
jgi:hypothetical protein